MKIVKFLSFVSCVAPVLARTLPPLMLPCGDVRLDPEALPALVERLEAVCGAESDETAVSTVYIVQYDMEVATPSAVRKAVSQAGATILSPVSGGAYLVRANPLQAVVIFKSGAVVAAREYLPEDKMEVSETKAKYDVALFSDCTLAEASAALSAIQGCTVLAEADRRIVIEATPAALQKASAVSSVQSLSRHLEVRLMDPDATRGGHQ